jgi:type VI secretion system FHA domain protein
MEQRFDYLGGTIGRNADNQFVLPDVSKFISRHHCRIEYSNQERGYTLTDLGSNASQVNGQPVGNGKTARLKNADTLMIGDYQLQVIDEDQASAAPAALDPFAYQASPSQYSQPAAASLLDQAPSSNQGAFQDPLAAASILDVGMGSNADPLGFNSLGMGGDPLGGPLGGAPAQLGSYRGSEPDHLSAHHMPFVAPNVAPNVAPAAPPSAWPQQSGAASGGGFGGGATIPDDFLSHPVAPAHTPPAYAQSAQPAYTAPAASAGSAPVAMIPDDFDWLAPAPATPAAAPAWGQAPQAPAAPISAAPTIPAGGLLGDFDPLAPAPGAGAASVAAPATVAQAAPVAPAAPTLAANFDPLGAAPAPVLGDNFDPLGLPTTPVKAAPQPSADFDPLGLPITPAKATAATKPAPDFDPLGLAPAAPTRTAPVVDDLESTMANTSRPKPGVRSLAGAAQAAPQAAPQAAAQSAPQPVPQATPAPQPIARPAPTAAPRPAAVAATPAAAAPAAGGAGNREVMQALLRGLGVPDLKIKGTDEQLAEQVGKMLRGAVEGTMGVLMARSATKREIRIEATMLAQKGNNPMKFFPDPEQAMSQMLTNAWAGYLPGEKAVADAFDDLKAHELATIAGMRAALQGVLERFDPQAIEARLAVPTVMDKMLASNRKAKMWDRMVELYKQMTSEADDDFQRLFGEKFAAAYEEQTARLRMSRKP